MEEAGHTAAPSPSKRVHFCPVPVGKAVPVRPPLLENASVDNPSPAVPISFDKPLSPGSSDENWTIEAQRAGLGCMDAAECPGSAAQPSTVSSATEGWLESARKVDDLRSRLDSLEQVLKEMETKAVAHLDRSLQQKVLATAAKIVQKRFMADQELDKKLQQQILKTAIKVVERHAGDKSASSAEDPARQLHFEQDAPEAGASMQQFVEHVEAGLGEVVRRLEKKVDAVASLLDQGGLELLEARLASGLVRLEARVDHLEHTAQQQQPGAGLAAGSMSQQLLERVAAVEEAMAEQNRAVRELLAALGARAAAEQPDQWAQRVEAAGQIQGSHGVPAVEAQAGAAQTLAQRLPSADAQGGAEEQMVSREPAAASSNAAPAAGEAQPGLGLHQRRVQQARRPRSSLGEPGRASVAPVEGMTAPAAHRAPAPRLRTTRAAGAAQHLAIATARQQLAQQAQRAREEAERESPVWLTMVYVFGWALLLLLGLAAVLMGTIAALMRSGRLQEQDLAFLWE